MTKDEKKRYLILKDPNIYKGLLLLALPLMINNLIKTLHDIVDMFFVSRGDGSSADAVASIQMTFPVLFAFLSLGIGLAVAGTSLISQLLGADDLAKAKRYAGQLFLLALGIGILINILAYFLAPVVMAAMGAEGDVYTYSVAYLRIRAFEMPLLLSFFAYMATRQASGDTVSPVLISGSAIILNILLSPIFIIVLGLGVPGAAMATLLANLIIMPFAVRRLFTAKDGIAIRFKDILDLEALRAVGALKDKLEIMLKLLRTAIPASLGQALTAVGFGVMNGVIYAYGTETIAAFGLGNRLLSMILHPVMAMGAILSAYIGQNIGALNPSRAKETFKKCMILSAGIMAVGSLGIMVIREPLAALFLGDDAVALKLTVDYMFFILLGLPLMAVFQTFIGTYNGTGNTHYTFIISVARLWVIRIPLVLLMGWLLPTRGSRVIWEAMLISNILITIVGYLLYTRIDFQPKVPVEKKKRVRKDPLSELHKEPSPEPVLETSR